MKINNLTRPLRDITSVFSNKKSFNGWIGHERANRYGLHIFRILASDLMQFIRRLPFVFLAPKAAYRFKKTGCLIIEDFLDRQEFIRVRQEIQQQLERLPEPSGNLKRQVFGDKLNHEKGYDRYDGSTLNRFVSMRRQSSTWRAFQSLRMHRLTLALFGMVNTPMRYFIYELRHGSEVDLPDSQKETHRDTFHHTYKLWYFTEDVTLDSGPFEYCADSHLSTFARLKWEYRRSVQASSGETPFRGGAFRASDAELQAMHYASLQPVCVRANSLLIADTRGFHRRGHASPGTTRSGIFGYFRPRAFWPLPQL
jgi:hypothetical protein